MSGRPFAHIFRHPDTPVLSLSPGRRFPRPTPERVLVADHQSGSDFSEQFPRHRYLGQLEGDIQAHLFVGCAADGMIHRILFNARRLVHENLDFHPERERVGAASGFGLVGADLALGLKSAQTFVCTLSQKSPENRFSGGLRLFWECMLIGGRTPLR